MPKPLSEWTWGAVRSAIDRLRSDKTRVAGDTKSKLLLSLLEEEKRRSEEGDPFEAAKRQMRERTVARLYGGESSPIAVDFDTLEDSKTRVVEYWRNDGTCVIRVGGRVVDVRPPIYKGGLPPFVTMEAVKPEKPSVTVDDALAELTAPKLRKLAL